MQNNETIIRKSAVDTTAMANGLLSADQSKKFLTQTFASSPLSALIRNEIRFSRKGEINKLGVSGRILREKTEGTDDEYRVVPNSGKISYETTAVRLPWEITEETFRENIEGQGFEETVTRLMTAQLAEDLEDLCLNGDESLTDGDDGYDFLHINTGWIKQIEEDGNVEDRSDKSDGVMSIDVFYDALRALPNRYNNGRLKWIMSPHRKQEWDKYLLGCAITGGAGIGPAVMDRPASIEIIEAPSMPDDKIILTDPKNLIKVHSYNIIIRKTTEGREAVMQDKRFYVVHMDFDPVIENADGAVIITGLADAE